MARLPTNLRAIPIALWATTHNCQQAGTVAAGLWRSPREVEMAPVVKSLILRFPCILKSLVSDCPNLISSPSNIILGSDACSSVRIDSALRSHSQHCYSAPHHTHEYCGCQYCEPEDTSATHGSSRLPFGLTVRN